MTSSRHLRLVPDIEPDNRQRDALIDDLVELAAAGCIERGEHLWNPETDVVVDADQATFEIRSEFKAARLRHAHRLDRGEPVSAEAAAMQDAIRRYRVALANGCIQPPLPTPDQL